MLRARWRSRRRRGRGGRGVGECVIRVRFFFFKQKTAYEMATLLEFRRVLFRSLVSFRGSRATVRVVEAGGAAMETVVDRPAALDVPKEQVTACVRVPGAGGGREQQVAEFKTTVQGLLALRDWLQAHGATHVAMEASGVYWKPPWAILEDAFECLLVNARHVKQVPGRKTDVSDAAWLCQLLEAGLLKASFVPPKPIRTLRNLTRYRKAQIGERQREANRLHKILEDT